MVAGLLAPLPELLVLVLIDERVTIPSREIRVPVGLDVYRHCWTGCDREDADEGYGCQQSSKPRPPPRNMFVSFISLLAREKQHRLSLGKQRKRACLDDHPSKPMLMVKTGRLPSSTSHNINTDSSQTNQQGGQTHGRQTDRSTGRRHLNHHLICFLGTWTS